MTPEQSNQLKAALERRGYTREIVTSEWQKLAIGQIIHAVESGWQTQLVCSRTLASVIDECLGQRQHHVWCAHCHEPLLRGGLPQLCEDIERLLGASDEEIAALKERDSGWCYRSAKRGPSSTPLTVCPNCLTPLSGQTTQEIDDR